MYFRTLGSHQPCPVPRGRPVPLLFLEERASVLGKCLHLLSVNALAMPPVCGDFPQAQTSPSSL